MCCFNCRGMGHKARDCPSARIRRRPPPDNPPAAPPTIIHYHHNYATNMRVNFSWFLFTAILRNFSLFNFSSTFSACLGHSVTPTFLGRNVPIPSTLTEAADLTLWEKPNDQPYHKLKYLIGIVTNMVWTSLYCYQKSSPKAPRNKWFGKFLANGQKEKRKKLPWSRSKHHQMNCFNMLQTSWKNIHTIHLWLSGRETKWTT